MKVICIDASPESNDHKSGLLKEGAVYTVLFDCLVYGTDGKTTKGYALVEFGDKYGFDAKRFVPLSEIDELELVKERELLTT